MTKHLKSSIITSSLKSEETYMREKIILICEDCLSRNYTVERNKLTKTDRMVIKKYCPKCNKHTVHKETK